jgi:hypothetical protein
MQDELSYCHSNPIFWEQFLDLPARQYHYGGREASPTQTGSSVIVALHQVLGAPKTPLRGKYIIIEQNTD